MPSDERDLSGGHELPHAAPAAPAPPASTDPAPMTASLAPPLVSGPSSAPPGGALPPYATPQPSAGYPSIAFPHATPPPTPPTPRWIPVVVISGIVVLVIVAVAMVGFLLTAGGNDSRPVSPVATAEPLPTQPDEPTPEPEPEPDDGTDSATADAYLEGMIEGYKRDRDTGALWDRIPDTEFNRTAVTAFLYLLTDMKVALIWGVDDETAAEYIAEADRLEDLLLSEQPLGSNIQITLSEDRIFRYDGDTGEGGYTDE